MPTVNIFKIVVVIIAVAVILMAIFIYFDFSLATSTTIFSTIIVSLSAVATACFAYMGLSTWKERMRYDIATRLLALIHKYRDTLDEIINPFTSLFLALDELDASGELDYRKRKITEEILKNFRIERYNNAILVRQKIHVDISIINTSWDAKLRKIFDDMRQIEDSVRKNEDEIRPNLSTIEVTSNSHYARIEALQNLRSMQNDLEKFSKRLDELVKEAEGYLMPKIRL